MKDKDRLRGAQWLFSFRQMQREAASIINRICPTRGLSLDENFKAFKNTLKVLAEERRTSDEFSAFEEALEKLPRILECMKAATKSDVNEVHRIQEFEVKALSAFVEACNSSFSIIMKRKVLLS